MGWTSVNPDLTERKEEYLQAVFDAWSEPKETGRQGCLIAGAPTWLLEINVCNCPNLPGDEHNLSKADVVWRLSNTIYVLELKHAKKFEPLALAEVLFHAARWKATLGGNPPVKAVTVTQEHSWMHLAVNHLYEHGLDRGALQHLEITHLERNGTPLLWIDQPLACLQPSEPPTGILDLGQGHWYLLKGTRSWLFSRDALPSRRPPIQNNPYAMVSEIDGIKGAYLFYQGKPSSSENSEKRRAAWKEEYRMWQPTEGEERSPALWF